MQFELASSPALERFGGPSEDSAEGNFIDLNQPALAANWAHNGERFVVRYELDSPKADEAARGVVLMDLEKRQGRSPDAIESATEASYGVLFFQTRGPDIMHVEYLVECLRGTPVPASAHPCRHAEVEKALRRWLRAHEAEVVAAVRDQAGELR